MAEQSLLGHAICPDDDERRRRAGRHVHFRTRRTDAGHEIDQPVDVGGRILVGKFRCRPIGMAEQGVARCTLAGRMGPELFRHEGHEGMQQLVDLFEHIGGTGLCFLLRHLVIAMKTGFRSSRYQSQNWFQTKR